MTEDLSKQVDAIISDRNRLSVELEAVKQDYAVAHAEIERLKLSNAHLQEDRSDWIKLFILMLAILAAILAASFLLPRIAHGAPVDAEVLVRVSDVRLHAREVEAVQVPQGAITERGE